MTRTETLLIYIQVSAYSFAGEIYLDRQACNGLRRWADNFDHVTVMLSIIEGTPPQSCVPLDRKIQTYVDKLQVETLPVAYRPDQFARCFENTRKKIAQLITQSKYLNFAIGACFFGDWGAVACWEAYRLGRAYSVWTDRVESQVVRSGIGHGPWRRDVQARLYHRPMAALEKAVIRRAALGLFHGKETYEAYAPHCSNPHVVHDIHISPNDHLPIEDVNAKQTFCQTGPLKICYVGRLDPMKGPYDWVSVMEGLHERGLPFEAIWLGSGSEEQALRSRVKESGLQKHIKFPGYASDPNTILDMLRQSHIMLFCHKTPESPRCLIEALISAVPIIGYDSAYPRDLIAHHGGGVLTPMNNIGALTEVALSLGTNRVRLAELIGKASKDGVHFDDVSVFRHRSDLIKAHL